MIKLPHFFCSSKKTLASGVPMAQILFIGQPLGMIVLPIMIFHQIQLMVCGVIARIDLPKKLGHPDSTELSGITKFTKYFFQ